MRCDVVWAYFALSLCFVSVVYAAPHFNARASSDEASGSRLPKRTHSNADIQSKSPDVHVSFIVKGALRGVLNNRQTLNQHDQGRIEMLIKRAANKKWGWTEDKIGNLKFIYPDDRIHFNGPLIFRFLFKGPFLDCELENCLGEATFPGSTEEQPTVSGFIYTMTQNGKKKIRKFTILTLIDNQASVAHFESMYCYDGLAYSRR
ncbi:hypothetical protein C8J55DRAFT_526498 [Lentinula edodes]|uniref:Uncharacterized protein n=1 Tax=Lentinula lateritia TaxID=40482 RepID=A0A9W9DFN0_9AGAR|nr:hypothetical protein C8J55DRAFT_526498 [Lentinula edodes]